MSEAYYPPGARGVSLHDQPTVSVVVASRGSDATLSTCLAALLPQAAKRGAQVIVARPGKGAQFEDTYPAVRFVSAPPDADLPSLRARGLATATGDIVALTEDHCIVSGAWLDQLVDAAREHEVVGGGLEQAPDAGLAEWGAFFAEYGLYNVGLAADGAPAAAGANVAYRRSVLGDVIALAAAGEWENVVHRKLHTHGSTFTFLRKASVQENRPITVGAFCRDRFAHGREFARRRLRDEPHRRWLLLAGAWTLPFLLTRRLARVIRPIERGAFLHALPFVFLFLTAWSAGEAAGYLLGSQREGSSHP